MIITFWLLTAMLIFLSLIFLLPAISGTKGRLSCLLLLLVLVYPLYAKWGAFPRLHHYYSDTGTHERVTQDKMRPLFSQLKKQQGRLRLKLIENPQDALAQALLFELLGVEALYREDKTLAITFWETALTLLPSVPQTDQIRQRIIGLKAHVEKN